MVNIQHATCFVPSGLKKLLAQYPSLFVIDDDYVKVNLLQNSASTDADGSATPGGRDYIQQSKDYFKHKLLQYGIGTEVPIKCLLGHRSQASPQIRHISGQHIKEFTDFLSKHPDTFNVTDECVTLVGVENMQDVPLSERLHLPLPHIDTKATQQLLDFFAACIELKGPMLVDQLFKLVTAQFAPHQYTSMIKTAGDLNTFLKMFSDCFHIQANLVTLLHKPKLSEAYIQQAQARTRDQLTNSFNNSNATRRTQSPVTMGDFKLNEPVSNLGGGGGGGGSGGSPSNRSEPNSGFDSLNS